MSARKVTNPELLQPLTVHAQTTRLDLPARAVRIRRNGIEFRADTPIPVWTEMTVAMQPRREPAFGAGDEAMPLSATVDAMERLDVELARSELE